MSPLSARARALIERYKSGVTPRALSKARIFANVMRAIAPGDHPRTLFQRTTDHAEESATKSR